jgi:hypothetical protein
MRLRNVKFQNHNENADRHLIASALRWRPFYTPGDFTVTNNVVVPEYAPNGFIDLEQLYYKS